MSYLTKQVITNADGTTVETEPQEVAEDGGYITYDSDTATLTLGKNGDPSKVQIDNDGLNVVSDNVNLAKFSHSGAVLGSESSFHTKMTSGSFEISEGTQPIFLVQPNYSYDIMPMSGGDIFPASDSSEGTYMVLYGQDSTWSGAAKLFNTNSGTLNIDSDDYKFNNGGLPIASGGTGATTVAGALTNLGAWGTGAQVETITGNNLITASSGFTVSSVSARVIFGRVCQIIITMKTTSALSANRAYNIGTLSSELKPSLATAGGDTLALGYAAVNGAVYYASLASKTAGASIYAEFTYILANEYTG